MIFPTLWVDILDRKSTDRYGQPKLAKIGRVKVAPVKLIFSDDHTTVRTDSSGSHGSALEQTSNVVVLVRPGTPVEKGDALMVLGHKVMVTKIHARYTVTGKHDHNELHCEAWV